MNESDTVTSSTGPIEAYEFPSLDSLKGRHLKLLELEAAPGESETPDPDFIDEVRDFMCRASATGRVLDEQPERATAQTLLNYWSTVLFRAGLPEEEMPPTSLAELDENAGRDLDDDQCPYCGVEAYTEENAHLFFGRKEVVEKWLRLLEKTPILVALGASGSGKTSLVQAGFLPKLKQSGTPWQVHEEVLQESEGGEQLLHWLEKREIEAAAGPAILIIYRLDEGLLAVNPKMERRLLEALVRWLEQDGRRRALLVGRIESSALITEWLKEGNLAARSHQEIVPAFGAADLRAVIERPAKRIGLRFDEGLVDTLINDFNGDPAALALLQFTLLKLWAGRTRNRITWDAYHKIGGGRGAVETSAEQALAEAQVEEGFAKNIFLRIVRPTFTSALAVHQLPEANLGPAEDEAKTAQAVKSFARAGLLRVHKINGTRMVEVSQEALLRKWPRFLLWLEDAKTELLHRQRISDAAAQWRASDRHHSALWTGRLLEDALEIRDQLSPEEAEFIKVSERAVTRRRFAAAAAIVLCFLGITYYTLRAYYGLRETNVALDLERGQRHVEALDPAGAFLFFSKAAANDPDAGNDFSRWIWRRLVHPSRLWNDPADENKKVHDVRLQATWWQLPHLKELLELPDLTHSEFSPDGRYVAGIGRGRILVWYLNSSVPEAVDPLADYPNSRVLWATFSPTAKSPLLAVALAQKDERGIETGRVVVFDPRSRQIVGVPITTPKSVPQKVWFDPTGEHLLIIEGSTGENFRSLASIWDFRSGKRSTNTLPCSSSDFEPINWGAFSPDGKFVAIAAGNLSGTESRGEAKIWDWNSRANLQVNLQHDGGPLAYIEFDPAGKRVVTSEGANESTRGAARIWSVREIADPTSGALEIQTEGDTPLVHRGAVTRARFSPDGLWVATASRDRTTRLWHIRTQKEVFNFKQSGDVYDVAFSPDGRFLAAGGRDRNARVWEIATGQVVQVPLNHSETVAEVAFSRDGRSLLTSSKGLARIYAVDAPEPKTEILQSSDTIAATVSNDGQHILTVSGENAAKPNALEIWESNGERIASEQLPRDAQVRFVLLHPEGKRCAVVLSGLEGGKTALRVYAIGAGSANPKSMETLAAFDADPLLQGSEVLGGWFDREGKRVALILRKEGVLGNKVALGEIGTKSLRLVPDDGVKNFSRLQFSPRGTYLLGCFTSLPTETGRAKLWRLDGKPVPSTENVHQTTEITTATFNDDENLLLTGSTDDDAWLWRVGDKEVASVYRFNGGATNTHTADLTQVLFSHDGKQALTAARDQTAILWDLTSNTPGGKRLAVLHHSASVTSAAFSKDGQLILTLSAEPNIRIWSSATGELLALLNPTGEVLQAGFSPATTSVAAIAQSLAPRPGWSGAQGEELFAREIRPMTWSLKPLKLEASARGKVGSLIAARQLNGDTIENVNPIQLSEIWSKERGDYRALFDSPLPDEEFFRASELECEGNKEWFAAAWGLTRLLETAKDDSTRARLLLKRANAYARADNYAESLPKCIADREAAMELGKNKPEDLANLADAHLTYANTFAKAEEGDEQWDAAIAELEQAIKISRPPAPAELYLQLGEAYAGRREYLQAQGAFRQALELSKKPGEAASAQARLALIGWLIGNEAGKKEYRDICLTLREPEASGRLLWPAVLTNAFEEDPAFLDAVVAQAKERADDAPANYYRRNTYGAALYRAGRYEEASRQLELARTSFLADRANDLSHRYDHALRGPISPAVEGRPVDLLFLAMTNAKLQRTSGWDWLRKARETPELAQTIRQVPRTSYPIAYQNLGLELLYDEAYNTLRSRAARPPSP